MSRKLMSGLVFMAVTVIAVFMISVTGMNPGGFKLAQAAEASEKSITAEGRESRERELQQLLTERRKLLTGIVQSMKLFLESGRVGIEEYRDANIALLRAEMDLCKTRNDRLEILEKIVQLHKNCEDMMERRAKEGRSLRIDVDKAKVARLEAQIELARENLKG